jgi:hypothetical protein
MFPHLLRLVHPVAVAKRSTRLELASMRADLVGIRMVDNGNSSPGEILGQALVPGNDLHYRLH